MSQRLCCFLVVFLLMFQGRIFGQESPHLVQKKITEQQRIIQQSIKRLITGENRFNDVHVGTDGGISKFEKVNYTIVEGCYTFCGESAFSYYLFHVSPYSKESGFFCRKELQLDKTTKIPLRFRLGSLEYVNWMEQKPNAIKPR